MAKITVLIEEGRVKAIEGIPVDMEIEVRNYDVQRFEQNRLSQDENGRTCEILEWHAPE